VIFDEFFLSNSSMPYDPICNQIEYTLSLFYYKNQKYDGSDLDKIVPTKI
jgi:hypothetical protein